MGALSSGTNRLRSVGMILQARDRFEHSDWIHLLYKRGIIYIVVITLIKVIITIVITIIVIALVITVPVISNSNSNNSKYK